MQCYLMTDPDGKDWRGLEWAAGTTHEEPNDNHYFVAHYDLHAAAYLSPEPDRKFWLCTGTPVVDLKHKGKFSKLECVSVCEIAPPTELQRVTFAILCAMNVVLNAMFREWAVKYLKGEDRSRESAQKLSEYLTENLGNEPDGQEYVGCVHAVLAAVTTGEMLFAASAAERVFYDTLLLEVPLNLGQTAQIVNVLPPEDIAGIL